MDAEAGGRAHRAVADARAADAVPEAHQRAQQSRAEERVLVWQSRDRELHVPERRESEDDRGLRLRDGRDGRSDCRAAARQGDGAAVARARDRLQLRGRQLRQRVQLRLHEHAGLVVEDDPAADRSEPARGVRAAVRRWRLGRGSQGRAAQERQHSGLGDRGHGAPRPPPRAVGPHARRRISRHAARGRAAHSESRAAGRRCAAGRADAAGRRPVRLGRAREADVRPAGARAAGRHHARHHVPARARSEHADVSADWRGGAASRDVASPELAGEAREAGEDQRVSRVAVRVPPREAQGHEGRRRHAAGSLDVRARQRSRQSGRARSLEPADCRRGRRFADQGWAAHQVRGADAADQPARRRCSTRSACRPSGSRTAPARSTNCWSRCRCRSGCIDKGDR